ncbi:hypothetical protein LB515_02455 [Mesorhizobium sp. CA15]|uniref:hypothetical protein n=1 Tax=Mesorhizobium sp. CA15 TaxID=2876641 RepID=UPI001CD0663E|nr:hypothetical protein [Mesorhizobium sp. CA15]MBZ9864228.1 hypothetical protein [Mesorhizobium sp. CA15]
MGCNAWNHPKNCSCGWGGVWHGNTPYGSGRGAAPPKPVERSYPRALPLSMRSASLDLRSLTVPNARCPVCGMSVFFYRNSHGSRVFFDDLGPPWPKHPCTDTSTWRENRSTQITAPAKKPKHRADWLGRWLPFLIVGSSRQQLDLLGIGDGKSITLRLDRDYRGCAVNVAYLRRDQSGKLDVSILSETGAPETFAGTRIKQPGAKTLTGFLLYCQREREICRAIDARRELAEIKANRHSNRKTNGRLNG